MKAARLVASLALSLSFAAIGAIGASADAAAPATRSCRVAAPRSSLRPPAPAPPAAPVQTFAFQRPRARGAASRSGPASSPALASLLEPRCHLWCDCDFCRLTGGPDCGGEYEMCSLCWKLMDDAGECNLNQ